MIIERQNMRVWIVSAVGRLVTVVTTLTIRSPSKGVRIQNSMISN